MHLKGMFSVTVYGKVEVCETAGDKAALVRFSRMRCRLMLLISLRLSLILPFKLRLRTMSRGDQSRHTVVGLTFSRTDHDVVH